MHNNARLEWDRQLQTAALRNYVSVWRETLIAPSVFEWVLFVRWKTKKITIHHSHRSTRSISCFILFFIYERKYHWCCKSKSSLVCITFQWHTRACTELSRNAFKRVCNYLFQVYTTTREIRSTSENSIVKMYLKQTPLFLKLCRGITAEGMTINCIWTIAKSNEIWRTVIKDNSSCVLREKKTGNSSLSLSLNTMSIGIYEKIQRNIAHAPYIRERPSARRSIVIKTHANARMSTNKFFFLFSSSSFSQLDPWHATKRGLSLYF